MSDEIRVLQVVSTMNLGGVENMLMNLYRNIDREKIQFDFVVHRDTPGEFDNEIRKMGGKIYCAPPYQAWNHMTYKKWWENFLLKHPEYKIVHSHTYALASIQLKIAKKMGKVTIVHSHNTNTGKEKIKGTIKKILQKNIADIPDYLFACSDLAGKWLYGEKCTERSNYHVLKNAIDTPKYLFNKDVRQEVRDELGINNQTVIGHVGNFRLQKNHKYLLKIFREYQKKNSDAILLLVGGGDLKDEVEHMIREWGLENNAILVGVRSDVNKLMQAMDVFVFPSLHEGLPVSVIEAQASGLPCLISNSITEEVCITDLVRQISINQQACEWEKSIDEMLKYTRKNMLREIEISGYDIRTSTQWLTDFYQGVLK